MPSAKPVFQKLGLKPTHRAVKLAVPKEVEKTLTGAPKGFAFAPKLAKDVDFVLGFYESAAALKKDLPKLAKALAPTGMAWICWRKGHVTDLGRDSIAALGDAAGLEGVATASIDDDWSALKLMMPKAKRR